MQKRQRLFVAVGLLLAVGLLVFITPHSAVSQKPGTSAPTAHPSPSPTDVNVVNTPDVNVANTVTAHLDSNQVVVGNTGPIVTRDADGGEPVSLHATIAAGFAIGASRFYNVPNNKRLVVEFASARVMGANSSEHVRATIELGGGNSDFQRHFLVPTAIGTDDFVFSTPIKMYFAAGDVVSMSVSRDAAGAAMNVELQWSGRLIDAP